MQNQLANSIAFLHSNNKHIDKRSWTQSHSQQPHRKQTPKYKSNQLKKEPLQMERYLLLTAWKNLIF